MLGFEESLDFPNLIVARIDESPVKIIIHVETTETHVSCRVCGRSICRNYGKDKTRIIKHMPSFGKEVYISYQPNRYVCGDCDDHPTTTGTPPWHHPKSSYTKAYEKHILLELVNSTIKDVSVKEYLTEESIQGIVDRLLKRKIDWSSINYLGVIGIDEIAIRKGYKGYITIVSCRSNGKIRILATLKGRKKATVKAFLKSIPKKLKKTVEAVCVDMYQGYINAVNEVFKNAALIVIDRFHVAKLYRGELDKYRQKILANLKKELSNAEYEKIKGATRILRKGNECLTKKEKAIVNELFAYAPELMEAYSMAINLTHIFNTHQSKEEALIKFQEWLKLLKKSKLKFFDKFIKTFKKLKNEIANYFIDRNTSGFAEGLNNKIKVLKRRCYGIFNVEKLFQRLHLDVSGYDFLLLKS